MGLYLAAISISITDEEILLGHSTSIAQLSVSVPLLVNFGIAPLVFVMLHIMTLFRYYALIGQLREFHTVLDARVDNSHDRNCCLSLLVNVEFVVPRARGERRSIRNLARSAFFYTFVAVFPTMVLLLIQVSSLRIQNINLNRLQNGLFWIDLLVLAGFLIMHRRQIDPDNASRWCSPRRVPCLMLLLLIIPAIAHIRWLHVAGSTDKTVLETVDRSGIGTLQAIWLQPLDLLLCPQPPQTYEFRSSLTESQPSRSGWNLPFLCRFVTLTNRPLVDPVWNGGAIADLRDDKYYDTGDRKALDSVQGISLKGRILRFANLDQVELYRANLNHADLRHAILSQANLMGATMWRARLDDADMYGARLQGVYLGEAHLERSDMRSTLMKGATLESAHLDNVRLVCANLTRANLEKADLTRADLTCATLEGANLSGANLTNVIWVDTDLTGVIGYDPTVIPMKRLPPGTVCRASDITDRAPSSNQAAPPRVMCP
ncbi:MAG: pentapeptide repeat-containing protein [Acetobacteraceae bacterium]